MLPNQLPGLWYEGAREGEGRWGFRHNGGRGLPMGCAAFDRFVCFLLLLLGWGWGSSRGGGQWEVLLIVCLSVREGGWCGLGWE